MAKIGIKESILKTMMGHSDIGTTQKYYIHITDDDIVDEVIEKMTLNNDAKANTKYIENVRNVEEVNNNQELVNSSQNDANPGSSEMSDRMSKLEELLKAQMDMFSNYIKECKS